MSHGRQFCETQTEKRYMGETQQPGTRWEDLPADEQQNGYWLAVPDYPRSCLGGRDYEVIYVAHDVVCHVVFPCGLQDCESTRHWRFLRRLDLPASAAEVVAPVSRAAETEVRA